MKRCEKVKNTSEIFRITQKNNAMRCYLKNSGTTLTSLLKSVQAYIKWEKWGGKKKLDEILLPHQLVIFSLKNHPQLGLGLLRMVKKNPQQQVSPGIRYNPSANYTRRSPERNEVVFVTPSDDRYIHLTYPSSSIPSSARYISMFLLVKSLFLPEIAWL